MQDDEPVMTMRKTPSGIPGLDKMLNGGFIEGRPYLIIGGPGAGKSILTMQFLMVALNRGENALYVSLEEPYDEIRQRTTWLRNLNMSWKPRTINVLHLIRPRHFVCLTNQITWQDGGYFPL
jgi:predicted ATP-dependent serine protease